MCAIWRLGDEDPMSTLCRMVTEMKYEDLPSHVIKHAKLSILDTMAVTVGGSAMEGVAAVVDFVKEKGGKPQSLIPFYGGKVPASEAGMAIGPMARAMDFGDVHEDAAHTSEYTVPTLLAATGLKERVSGKDILISYVLGQEVLIRIGMAIHTISKGAPLGRGGGHYIFGPVASVGKLLGLSFDDLANAQGIARAMTQPHDYAMVKPPSLMMRVHHGFISQDAINACLLAKRGITGSREEVLLGDRGFLNFAKWETDAELITQRLGEKWEMLDTMMKAHSSCKCTHTSIDGILDLMEKHGFGADDIEHIHFDESTFNWTTVCIPKEVRWGPRSVQDCQFSLPYTVATAAYDKHVFLDSYTNEARQRKDVRDLMAKITAEKDSMLPPFASRITITLKDGGQFSNEYLHSKGHPKKPFSEIELAEKFRACVPYAACMLKDDVVNAVIETILNLENSDDIVKDIIAPITPSDKG